MEQQISKTQRRVRIAIWVVGIVFVAGNIFGGMLRVMVRRAKEKDLAGQSLQNGFATVEAVHGMDKAELGREMRPWALVRFEGKLYMAQTSMGAKLSEGERVNISYLRGKSGKVTVLSADAIKKNADGTLAKPDEPSSSYPSNSYPYGSSAKPGETSSSTSP